MNRFLPLIAGIQEPQLACIVGYLYNELTWLTSTHENHPKLGALMGAMGTLASHSHQAISDYYVPLPEQWMTTTEKILNARGRPKSECVAIGVGLLQRALPADLKAAALACCPGKVWAFPAASALLLPIFPSDEFERFERLPWCHEQDDQSLADNRALMAAYCPRIASLIDMLAEEKDWLDYDAMQAWVEQCRSQDVANVETFGLPMEL